MRNAGPNEAQAGIKIIGRNINNLRYAADTTLMAESEEELNSLLMNMKEESEKAGLKLIQKMKIMASSPITSWLIDGETMGAITDFFFLGSRITADGDCSEIKMKLNDTFSLDEKLWPTFSWVQLSHVQLFLTPWTAASQASLSITNSWSLLKLMSIELVVPSSHLILFHPCLLLPSIFPSIKVFSNELALCIRWPKYWRFNLSISPSNELPGLISFRMDRLDLLSVQGILKSLLQNHDSKASILGHSAFFIV